MANELQRSLSCEKAQHAAQRVIASFCSWPMISAKKLLTPGHRKCRRQKLATASLPARPPVVLCCGRGFWFLPVRWFSMLCFLGWQKRKFTSHGIGNGNGPADYTPLSPSLPLPLTHTLTTARYRCAKRLAPTSASDFWAHAWESDYVARMRILMPNTLAEKSSTNGRHHKVYVFLIKSRAKSQLHIAAKS